MKMDRCCHWEIVAFLSQTIDHLSMQVSRLLVLETLASLFWIQPATACSIVGSYRVPNTLELVDRSDTIALVRVTDGGALNELGMRKARLVPFALIKGAELPSEIGFADASLSSDRLKAVSSDSRNLVDANPDAFSGSCNRYVFDKNMILLVFLRKENNEHELYNPPFSRSLEDVTSADALWVKAVKIYVQIANLPPRKRRKEMETRRNFLRMELEDPDSRLLGLELDRALHEKALTIKQPPPPAPHRKSRRRVARPSPNHPPQP